MKRIIVFAAVALSILWLTGSAAFADSDDGHGQGNYMASDNSSWSDNDGGNWTGNGHHDGDDQGDQGNSSGRDDDHDHDHGHHHHDVSDY